jgi:hypothetical protein
VRFIQWGPAPLKPYHITITPRLGFAVPWKKTPDGTRERIRWAPHHGLQIVTWTGYRWVVRRQLLGSSKVKFEMYTDKDNKYGTVRNA